MNVCVRALAGDEEILHCRPLSRYLFGFLALTEINCLHMRKHHPNPHTDVGALHQIRHA